MEKTPIHPKAKELEKINEILDQNHSIYDLALQDVSPAGKRDGCGAQGMTAEQAVIELRDVVSGDINETLLAQNLANDLEHYVGLAEKAADQTERRIKPIYGWTLVNE